MPLFLLVRKREAHRRLADALKTSAQLSNFRGLQHGRLPVQASDVLAGLLKKAGAVDGALPKGAAWPPGVPQLPQLFREGQLVRCTVMGLQQVIAAPPVATRPVLNLLWA